MSWNFARAYNRLGAISLVVTVCVVCVWWLCGTTGQAEGATMTVALASTPSLERLRPHADLTHLPCTTLLHGTPLDQGHLKVQRTAPPRTQAFSTGFPRVEGMPLLGLDAAYSDGTFPLQSLLPIRGPSTFDLELAAVPGGPTCPPPSLRQTVRLAANPVVARYAWLLTGGLGVLVGITGVRFARSAAARKKRLSRAIFGSLLLCCSALAPISTVAAHGGHTEQAVHRAPERLIIRGDHGWELEIYAGPMPATAGQLLQLAIWLRKDGEVFPGMTQIAITVANLDAGQTVVETHLLARQGHTASSLQIYDGAPHTIAVTVRPGGGDASDWAPPTAVLHVDVVALHPPLAVQSRVMAILLGVFVVGIVVGFFVPRTSKAQPGA